MHKNIAKSVQEKKRQQCASLLKHKVPQKKIQKSVKISRSTVYRTKKSMQTRRTSRRKKGSGRRNQLLKVHKISIYRLLKSNPFLSCQDIKTTLRLRFSIECIRLYLRGAGFTRRKPYSNFLLTEDHIQGRLIWARRMQGFIFSPEIIFTDASSIWLFDNNHQGWFHRDAKNEMSIDKHSGKVHVWGAVSMMYGKLVLVTFRQNLDSELLYRILLEDLIPEANHYYPNGWFLQMDNDSKNTSGVIQKLVREKVPNNINWPSRSPDMNPIENVWKLLKQRVRKRLPQTIDELEDMIHEEWNRISDNDIIHICESFPDRVDKCIAAQGNRIKY